MSTVLELKPSIKKEDPKCTQACLSEVSEEPTQKKEDDDNEWTFSISTQGSFSISEKLSQFSVKCAMDGAALLEIQDTLLEGDAENTIRHV